MENHLQVNKKKFGNGGKRYQKLRLLLYSEDFDFAQSFSLYFQKDYHKIITVNDQETLLQIISLLNPEIIILDNIVNESLLTLINKIKNGRPHSKVFIFTSHAISQQEIVNRLNKIVDRIFYQPIDLSEFNQALNFYTAD
ncbi:MAG: hypothetical protein ACK4G1_01610 [Ignavibacteria bacterium]